MGTSATIATVAAWRKSAVSKPVKVAPTIVALARSTTRREVPPVSLPWKLAPGVPSVGTSTARASMRSEEHTSELQSLTNLVCRLLLEKKKKKNILIKIKKKKKKKK